jgi:hypothetical protein
LPRAALIVTIALLIGCGGDGGDTNVPGSERVESAAPDTGRPRPLRVERVRCPADVANCESAAGEILYVERVDPDGDGDAHFVLASRGSITAPGITVVDVRRDLRPKPLPGPGDELAAAGPVFRGSFGQKQIEAIEVRSLPDR